MDNHLKQIEKVINNRKILKNDILAKSLMNQGLFEQASKFQAPITQAITKTAEDTQKVIVESSKQTPPIISQPSIQNNLNIEVLNRTVSDKPFTPVLTNEYQKILLGKFPIWRIDSFGKSLTKSGVKFILYKKEDKEYIWNISDKDANEIILTDGLNEILFNNANNKDKILPEDIKNWELIIKQAGFQGNSYKNKNFWKSVSVKPPIVEGEGINKTVGKVDHSYKKQNAVITIPSDPDQLREALILQLAATQAGNSNTFNYTNAIMKELMKQKLIKSKDYRAILKQFFHI